MHAEMCGSKDVISEWELDMIDIVFVLTPHDAFFDYVLVELAKQRFFICM